MPSNQKPRVLICGSRTFVNYDTILGFVKTIPEGSVIIEGEAKGADKLARYAAEECGYEDDRILKFPADWDKYGRAAGPIRNKQMLTEGEPTHVIAFSDDLANSKGTKNMCSTAIAASVPVFVNPTSWQDVEEGVGELKE